jgi:Trk K+ transport system NAD-binding subunit
MKTGIIGKDQVGKALATGLSRSDHGIAVEVCALS